VASFQTCKEQGSKIAFEVVNAPGEMELGLAGNYDIESRCRNNLKKIDNEKRLC
jgi:hypothetical protein